MESPLLIKMVDGWSVHLFQQHDTVLRWGATATKGRDYRQGFGIDKKMAIRNLTDKIGTDATEFLRAFEIGN